MDARASEGYLVTGTAFCAIYAGAASVLCDAIQLMGCNVRAPRKPVEQPCVCKVAERRAMRLTRSLVLSGALRVSSAWEGDRPHFDCNMYQIGPKYYPGNIPQLAR